jgi:hypothetical protein
MKAKNRRRNKKWGPWGRCGCPDCRDGLTSVGKFGKHFGVVKAEVKVEFDLSLLDNASNDHDAMVEEPHAL